MIGTRARIMKCMLLYDNKVLMLIKCEIIYDFRSTLHILDLPDANILFSYICKDNNSTLNGFKNYYLIHVPEHYSNNSQTIADYFVDSPLRFDSLTFAFKIETLSGIIMAVF